MTRASVWKLGWAPAVLALALAACSHQPSAAVQPVKKIFTLTPRTPAAQVGFLTAQFRDLTIREWVDPNTGKVVRRPDLHGTVLVKNGSTDQSVLLIKGKLVFLDAQGRVIPVAEIRGGTSFDFSRSGARRLDPGQETSLAIDVPVPRAGLQASDLQSVRLELTQAVNVPVGLKG